MSKTSRHSPKRLEVTVMFEPHRLRHDLLQDAYALLVPLPRRGLAAPQPFLEASRAEPPQDGERKVP
jgi:hypothetical protein